jgi:hypothetical protein
LCSFSWHTVPVNDAINRGRVSVERLVPKVEPGEFFFPDRPVDKKAAVDQDLVVLQLDLER